MNKINILQFSYQFIALFADIISYSIIIRIVVSWFSSNGMRRGKNPFLGFLYDVTEPFLDIARKFPHQYQMMDFSPIITLVMLDFFTFFIYKILNFLI